MGLQNGKVLLSSLANGWPVQMLRLLGRSWSLDTLLAWFDLLVGFLPKSLVKMALIGTLFLVLDAIMILMEAEKRG